MMSCKWGGVKHDIGFQAKWQMTLQGFKMFLTWLTACLY
jgi:hypothetical protein